MLPAHRSDATGGGEEESGRPRGQRGERGNEEDDEAGEIERERFGGSLAGTTVGADGDGGAGGGGVCSRVGKGRRMTGD